MSTYTLGIDFKSYWHAGGGRGGGLVADAVVQRDGDGLPVLPGRHLKGLLRDALERAEAWGWFENDHARPLAAQLFGQHPEQSNADTLPRAGCLRISDARLPAEVSTWLASQQGKGRQPLLFRYLFQTAVNSSTGSAIDHSLRGIEVSVPLELAAHIEAVPGRQPPSTWPDMLRRVLPLIDTLGAQRTRGLGRAVLTLEKST